MPDGFVVRGRPVEVLSSTGAWVDSCRNQILREHAKLGADRVAVRSSGLNEDGENRSYAGVFESILDVKAGALLEAVGKIAQSLSSSRVRASVKRPMR